MSTIKAINLTHPSGSTGITMDTSGNATVAGNVSMASSFLRNALINGDFSFNQRGGTNSSINTYALDRWRSVGGPLGFTISQQDSVSTYSPARYALRFQRTAGNTQTFNTGVLQGVESQNSYRFRGQSATLSFRARRGANFSGASNSLVVTLNCGTGTDENPASMTGAVGAINTSATLNTTLTTYSFTGSVPSNSTQLTVLFMYTPSGTAGADDWFEITDVQLEVGTVATPFERRLYGQELALCQRYAATFYPTVQTLVYNEVTGNNNAKFWVTPLPYTMRASPTVTYVGTWTGGAAAGGGTITGVSLSAANTNQLSTRVAVGSGNTAPNNSTFHVDVWSTNNAYVLLTAEL